MSDLDLATLLRDILAQATRKDRASDLKRYLVTDLEVIADKATKALSLVPTVAFEQDDAKLLYADTVTIKHEDLIDPEASVRDAIEFLIGLGSVPSVTGCKHETIIEYEIPCESTWQAFEYAHEVDTTLNGYGVYVDKCQSKIVTRPWRDTCAEAMRRLER